MIIQFANYICDLIFTWFYFHGGKKTGSSRLRLTLGVLFLLLTYVLYPSELIPLLSSSWTRFLCRFILYVGFLCCTCRLPISHIAYSAFFLTTVCNLCHNIFLAPVTYPILNGTVSWGFSFSVSQILCALIMVLTKAVCYYTVLKLVPIDKLEDISWLRFSILTMIALLTLYVKESQIPLMYNAASIRELSLFIILLHIALFILLILLENYQRQMQEHMSMRMQAITNQALLRNIQVKQDSDEAIRSLRHDLKNHMITLRLLMEHGRTDSAIQYADDFLAQTAPAALNVCTGHELLDGLLLEKLSPAIQNHISINVVLDFRMGRFIRDFDLCAIIGNLVDNAVEACSQVPQEKNRYIDISGGCSANCLMIHISNSFWTPPIMTDDLPRTLKADRQNHGFGLRNVSRILKKYHGNLTVSVTEPNRFTVAVLIPLPDNV